jgi:hypothetical protein
VLVLVAHDTKIYEFTSKRNSFTTNRRKDFRLLIYYSPANFVYLQRLSVQKLDVRYLVHTKSRSELGMANQEWPSTVDIGERTGLSAASNSECQNQAEDSKTDSEKVLANR